MSRTLNRASFFKRTSGALKLLVPATFLTAVCITMPNKGDAQGPPPPPPVGGPLPGLTATELQRFNAGRGAFLQGEQPQTGLGPVFNGTSCVQCHGAGGPGGASPNLGVSVVTRIGGMTNGLYSDLAAVGGALIQARSLREIFPNYPVPREVVPTQATFISRRQTTPVFGAGLLEAIPAATIMSRQDPTDANRDGISGKVNVLRNPETGFTEIGRFGWKGQHSSLHVFAGDAYLNEMGITSPGFPSEVLPQGRSIPPGADTVADPEDNGTDVNRLTDFMKLMAAPPAGTGSAVGRSLFTAIACTSCHTPAMVTGASPVAALANKQVNLYSDLLVHDMGPGLADGIRQGTATGVEWRTAPLWGLKFRRFYLHDGRATTLDAAVRLHGGEAAGSVSRYNALSATDRSALLNFLAGL